MYELIKFFSLSVYALGAAFVLGMVGLMLQLYGTERRPRSLRCGFRSRDGRGGPRKLDRFPG